MRLKVPAPRPTTKIQPLVETISTLSVAGGNQPVDDEHCKVCSTAFRGGFRHLPGTRRIAESTPHRLSRSTVVGEHGPQAPACAWNDVYGHAGRTQGPLHLG